MIPSRDTDGQNILLSDWTIATPTHTQPRKAVPDTAFI